MLRHVLQLVAGIAVARGWIADSDVETVVGAVLSLATVIWYAVDGYRAAREVKMATVVQGMADATKGIADAVQVAAVTEPTAALKEAAARVPGLRAALDRAAGTVLR